MFESPEIVIRCGSVANTLAAEFTDMHQDETLSRFLFDAYGAHHPAAGRCTVAGTVPVDMPAPQALRAVVAVAPALQRSDVRTAVFADERFLAGDERHGKERGEEDKKQKTAVPATSSP